VCKYTLESRLFEQHEQRRLSSTSALVDAYIKSPLAALQDARYNITIEPPRARPGLTGSLLLGVGGFVA
jgi:hypothetical protein